MIFESTCNTRPVLPDSLRFIRSDVPLKVTSEELQWLIDNNITTVIDLRENQEREERPCPLEKADGISYLAMPVTGGNAVPRSPKDVPMSYMKMCDGQMKRIIEEIIGADSNVLYFCNAGKDRTGVVTAILLMELGYSDEYIIMDYLQSGVNLRAKLEGFAAANSDIDISVITPKAEYIREFCRLYHEKERENAKNNFSPRNRQRICTAGQHRDNADALG